VDDRALRAPADVALTLLAQKGFDSTSMAEIAEVTGIAEDDVVDAIGTKDALVLDPARDMLVSVVDELGRLDPKTPVVEALLSAHFRVLNDILDDVGPIPLDRMRKMGKAIISSAELQKKVAAQRVDMLAGVLTDHFDVPVGNREVQRGLRLWSAVLAATYLDVLDKQGRFDPGVDDETPESMRDRLNRAFRIVTGRPTARAEDR
jgi:AcrR family transcriptional regulator